MAWQSFVDWGTGLFGANFGMSVQRGVAGIFNNNQQNSQKPTIGRAERRKRHLHSLRDRTVTRFVNDNMQPRWSSVTTTSAQVAPSSESTFAIPAVPDAATHVTIDSAVPTVLYKLQMERMEKELEDLRYQVSTLTRQQTEQSIIKEQRRQQKLNDSLNSPVSKYVEQRKRDKEQSFVYEIERVEYRKRKERKERERRRLALSQSSESEAGAEREMEEGEGEEESYSDSSASETEKPHKKRRVAEIASSSETEESEDDEEEEIKVAKNKKQQHHETAGHNDSSSEEGEQDEDNSAESDAQVHDKEVRAHKDTEDSEEESEKENVKDEEDDQYVDIESEHEDEGAGRWKNKIAAQRQQLQQAKAAQKLNIDEAVIYSDEEDEEDNEEDNEEEMQQQEAVVIEESPPQKSAKVTLTDERKQASSSSEYSDEELSGPAEDEDETDNKNPIANEGTMGVEEGSSESEEGSEESDDESDRFDNETEGLQQKEDNVEIEILDSDEEDNAATAVTNRSASVPPKKKWLEDDADADSNSAWRVASFSTVPQSLGYPDSSDENSQQSRDEVSNSVPEPKQDSMAPGDADETLKYTTIDNDEKINAEATTETSEQQPPVAESGIEEQEQQADKSLEETTKPIGKVQEEQQQAEAPTVDGEEEDEKTERWKFAPNEGSLVAMEYDDGFDLLEEEDANAKKEENDTGSASDVVSVQHEGKGKDKEGNSEEGNGTNGTHHINEQDEPAAKRIKLAGDSEDSTAVIPAPPPTLVAVMTTTTTITTTTTTTKKRKRENGESEETDDTTDEPTTTGITPEALAISQQALRAADWLKTPGGTPLDRPVQRDESDLPAILSAGLKAKFQSVQANLDQSEVESSFDASFMDTPLRKPTEKKRE